jgi:exosortase N
MNRSGWRYFFPACLAFIGIVNLHEYVDWVLLPFLLSVAAIIAGAKKATGYSGRRYAVTALVFILLAIFIPVKTFLFLALAFAVFYWVETYHARIGILGLAALFVGSPIFAYGANAFSFPIRLQLSAWVGQLLSRWQENISVQGNIILKNGQEFSVDPACMGLHMLSVSLLLGIFLTGLMQRRSGRELSLFYSLLLLLSLLLLNIVSNIIRIVLLVQFHILPANPLHSLTGLVCLLLYVCLPGAFLARYLVVKKGRIAAAVERPVGARPVFLRWLLLAGLFFSVIRVQTADTWQSVKGLERQTIPGYTASLFAPGILKIADEKSLIYVKFIRGFYDTEHNPTMCWEGSGYVFSNIRKERIGNHTLFTARLTKGTESLYTAWWFGNHEICNTNQWQWRWDLLRTGRRYAVINITAASRELLEQQLGKINNEKKLKPLFE